VPPTAYLCHLQLIRRPSKLFAPPSSFVRPLQPVHTPLSTFVTPQLICTPQFIRAPSNLFAPASLPLPCLCTSWACELTDGYRSTSHPSHGLRARPGLAQASQNPRPGPKPPPSPHHGPAWLGLGGLGFGGSGLLGWAGTSLALHGLLMPYLDHSGKGGEWWDL
jgi:hypothetical protein